MTDPIRVGLLDALTQLSGKYPNWRLGQLVANVAGWAENDVWDVDDRELLNAIRTHLGGEYQENLVFEKSNRLSPVA